MKTQYGVLVHEETLDCWVTRDHAFRCAQNVARAKGYAVALHGSQIKDVDLIAAPWTESASETSPHTLAALIAYSLPGVLERDRDGEAGTAKPHGRVAFTISPYTTYGADHWYIDLSVMPTAEAQPTAAPSEKGCE
jgi:hypothetical protein